MIRRRFLAAGLLATTLSIAPSGPAHAQAPASPERLAAIAQSFANRGLFSGAVLVARGEQLLLDRGWGLANQEWEVPNSPATKFLLASVSKQFTAAAVLRLVDQGKLGLDDAVSRHLPGLPAAWNAITVRHLLAHTSGIPNHTDGDGLDRIRFRAMTPRELVDTFRDAPLDFAPGSNFAYSNSGYVLLGVLIETLSGKPYGEFVQAELFAPLGMASSGLAHSGTIVPRLASGYAKDGAALRPATFVNMSVPYAAGALYGSTGDLLKWQRGLYGGRLISPASLAAMTTPVKKGYAFGLNVSMPSARLSYGHAGGIDGFSTYLLYEPAQQLTVAVLANLEGAASPRLAQLLANAANGQPVVLPEERKVAALPPAVLAKLQGSFGSAEPGPLWLTLRGDALWARLARHPWVRLVPEGPTRFYAPDADAELHVELGADGTALAVTLPELPGSPRWTRSDRALPTLGAQPVYLRGSMNGWSTQHRLVAGVDGQYRVGIELAAGAHEFKVASADWAAIDFGIAAPASPLPGRGSVVLAGVGRNIGLKLDKASRCEFSVDDRDVVEPRLTVECVGR